MSIRGFHLVFITIATLLCLGMAIWVFKFSGMDVGFGMASFGIASAVAALALPIYGYFFYQKLKKHQI